MSDNVLYSWCFKSCEPLKKFPNMIHMSCLPGVLMGKLDFSREERVQTSCHLHIYTEVSPA